MASFSARARALPRLGAGGAPGGLDPLALRRSHPRFAAFLEIGLETAKGLDGDAEAWLEAGLPTTYHFLDINLDEAEDFDRRWLAEVRAMVGRLDPAWLCGDAGLWHFGPRERGHMLLLPPVLSDEAARAMAEGIVRLREETGREVLPENPPGQVFLGDLHLLDFFARVCEYADTGMLLDAAHLAIFQRVMGHEAETGLDGFPLERVIEVHVAGASLREVPPREGGDDEGTYTFVEDDHSVEVLPETWRIFERVAAGASELRAVVFECERNTLEATLPGFARIEATLAAAGSPLAEARS